MKKILLLLSLLSSTITYSAEDLRFGEKAIIKSGAGVFTGISAVAVDAMLKEPFTYSKNFIRFARFSGVSLAATGGYMVGSIIVDIDKTYFRGVMISEVGDFLGPVNRVIYNLLNEDELPEVIEFEDEELEVIGTGSKH